MEKGGALTAALAAARKSSDEREGELRRAMREGEMKLRDRIERLEADNANLRRCAALRITAAKLVLPRPLSYQGSISGYAVCIS